MNHVSCKMKSAFALLCLDDHELCEEGEWRLLGQTALKRFRFRGCSWVYRRQGANNTQHRHLHPSSSTPTCAQLRTSHTHLPRSQRERKRGRDRKRGDSLEGQTISGCWRNAWHISQLREESKTDSGSQTHAQRGWAESESLRRGRAFIWRLNHHLGGGRWWTIMWQSTCSVYF